MKNLTRTQSILSVLLQIVSAIILAKASYSKFSGSEMSIFMFDTLGMEGTRLIIASIEAIAAVMLITKSLPQYGAILGFGTMLGAIIAHATVFGIEVNNDGGVRIVLMLIVASSTAAVMWIRKKNLPLIGYTFN